VVKADNLSLQPLIAGQYGRRYERQATRANSAFLNRQGKRGNNFIFHRIETTAELFTTECCTSALQMAGVSACPNSPDEDKL